MQRVLSKCNFKPINQACNPDFSVKIQKFDKSNPKIPNRVQNKQNKKKN